MNVTSALRATGAAAALLAAAALVSGCSEKTAGEAAPEPSNSSKTSSDPFGGRPACDVLNSVLQAHQPNFDPGSPDRIGGPNECQAHRKQNFGGGTVALGLNPTAPYNSAKGSDPNKMHAGEVNGRRAMLERDTLGSAGGCAISMDAGTNARADVTVELGADTDGACKLAQNVAESVEAQLPKAK